MHVSRGLKLAVLSRVRQTREAASITQTKKPSSRLRVGSLSGVRTG